MFKLYVYLELALRTRYGTKLRKEPARLDIAFGMYLRNEADQESAELSADEDVRKIRQIMQRRLKDQPTAANTRAKRSAK